MATAMSTVRTKPSRRSPSALHERYHVIARDTAKELAKYQAPQLKAITVSPTPPPAETVRRFTLTVFDHNRRRVDVTPPATLTPLALGNGFDDNPTP
jgi:hypothetical protein